MRQKKGSVGKLALLSFVVCGSLSYAQPGGAPRHELVAPPTCSTLRADHAATTFCTAVERTDGSGVKDIQLTLVAAKTPVQAGGYVVESETFNGMYTPPLIETTPGSAINISLIDALPTGEPANHMAGHTNIHTHGLLVSPQNELDSFGQGDNILVDLRNGGSFRYRIPIPTALAAGVLDNPNPIQHPDGLYWYHPHLHGLAKEQVSGGMSGVISIGRGSDLLVVNGAHGEVDSAATRELRNQTDVRYLELKDLQITTAVAPERANGSAPAVWNTDSDPAFCGTVDLNNVSNGYYRQAAPAGTTTAATSRPLWLFTINGQRYPRITIGAGRNHLWRIANLSATVTYIIELLDRRKPVPFEVTSVDGVVAGSAAAQNGSVSGIKRTTLLLMPAGRAEILVRNDGSNPGPDRNLVLQTRGLNTGPSGDTWPRVNLAEVHLAKTSPSGASPARSLMPAAASTALTEAHTVPGALGVAAAHTPGNACTRSVLKPGEWRRITLAQDDTTFSIGSEIANSQGPSSDVIEPAVFPMGPLDWDTFKHVCVSLGGSEIWEIDNTAQELHNFHLHQTKFRLARPEELARVGLSAASVVDPTGLLAKLGVDMAGESSSGATVWHDTLPVPLADTHGNSGKIFIVINFKTAEQVGRYVFHCHILEHEDKGMMAPIEILRAAK
jgi:FtsP/CotA-like multicopper oxidase with cupredoxin domain